MVRLGLLSGFSSISRCYIKRGVWTGRLFVGCLRNNAGSIHVFYGYSGGLSTVGDQIIHSDSPGIRGGSETSDNYGERLSFGDFDCDGKFDIAVGIPQEDIGSVVDAGGVNVLYGSSGGLSTVDDFWTQSSSNIYGIVETSDMYGGALASGQFNMQGCTDLVIAVPGEDRSGVWNAGGLSVLFGGSGGLTATGSQYLDAGNFAGVGRASGQLLGRVIGAFGLAGSSSQRALVVGVPGDSRCSSGEDPYLVFTATSGGLVPVSSEMQCESELDLAVPSGAEQLGMRCPLVLGLQSTCGPKDNFCCDSISGTTGSGCVESENVLTACPGSTLALPCPNGQVTEDQNDDSSWEIVCA